METLSRIQLYRTMVDLNEYSENQRKALVANITILDGIEEVFLSNDESPELKENKDPEILGKLRSNVMIFDELVTDDDKEGKRLVRKLNKLVDDYADKKADESQNSRNLFNKILNELGLYNSKLLPEGEMPVPEREKGTYPQVFLSHAYDDRLYAWALFEYFYSKGIYLYVDWMHHEKMNDGIQIKLDLQRELDESEQLLFLRTINSELNIQGKHMLRSWCAWELGNFYRKKNDEKYMINLYSVDDYNGDDNIQLHGLKLYLGIVNGLLDGREITL